MEANSEWTTQQIDQLIDASSDYKEKALLNEMKSLIKEQEKRKEQNQGELDGSLWSPGEWGV